MRESPVLESLVHRFATQRVLVVGDLVADHYVYGQTDRVSREAPVLIVRYESAEVKLGGAANVAANLRSLGGQVRALGLVAQDEMGHALTEAFRAADIQLSAVTGPGLMTETKMRVLAGGLNTRRQQMLRVDRGNGGGLPLSVQKALAARLREEAAHAQLVVVSDYGGGTLNDEVRAVLQALSREGMPICVDSRHALRTFVGATVCKPNEPELEALTGMQVRTEEDLLSAGKKALTLLPGSAVLVTRDHLGMALFESDGTMQTLAAHGGQEAVDVTGAGDSVLAALALSMAAGAPLLEAAQLANVAGALAVSKPGTDVVTRTELLDALHGSR